MRYWPIFFDSRGARALVVGGGPSAAAKARILAKAEASIALIAPTLDAECQALVDVGAARHVARAFVPCDAVGAHLVYVCLEDDAREAAIAQAARAAGALVTVADKPALCDFITPAIVDRDPVVVAIGTEGAAPVLARTLKAELEARLAPGLGALARIAASLRDRVAERLAPGQARRAFWKRFFDGPPVAGAAEAEALLEDFDAPKRGSIALVGAGPGDPELMTLQARKLLDDADVVIHDRLIGAGVLDLARREALLIDAGKRAYEPVASPDVNVSAPNTPQAWIDRAIVEHALAGKKVVRLKGGDPSMFARAEEELAAARDAGFEPIIAPGVTAASAAAAALGVSLTARGRNSSVTFLTGHDRDGLAEHEWRALAKPGAVAAIYMGKKAARFVQGRLFLYGAAADTPVSVVENAGRADVALHAGVLRDLPELAASCARTAPAILMLGLAPAAALAASGQFAPSASERAIGDDR